MKQPISLQEEGPRLYVVGNSYVLKDAIRAVGGRWDRERKQWWIGVEKRTEIEAVIAKAEAMPQSQPPQQPYEGAVLGKVEYKERLYFVRTQGPGSLHLVNFAGTLDFWAKEGLCHWVKRYERRKWDGRYPSLRDFRRWVDEQPTNR